MFGVVGLMYLLVLMHVNPSGVPSGLLSYRLHFDGPRRPKLSLLRVSPAWNQPGFKEVGTSVYILIYRNIYQMHITEEMGQAQRSGSKDSSGLKAQIRNSFFYFISLICLYLFGY